MPVTVEVLAAQMLRAIHLLAVATFIGSTVCSALVKIRAERIADSSGVRHALAAVGDIGRYVTGPSAGILTITGVLMVWRAGLGILQATWLQALLGLWAASALVALAVLDPALRALQTHVTSHAALDGEYWRRAKRWNTIALILLVCNVVSLLLATLRPM